MIKKKLILIAAISVTIGTSAKEVSQQVAVTKAEQLMQNRVEGFDGKASSTKVVTYNGRNVFYVVQFSPQGWAIISADDTSTPLIGYSPEGVYQVDNLPYNMQCQMDIYRGQILDNARQLYDQHSGWQTRDGLSRRASRRATEKIAPLIQVNWNQSNPYWKYCPTTSSGQHAYVGCVAVGMAQAMSVAQYPAHATGSKGYNHNTFGWLSVNFDNEPAYNWPDILSGANGRDDVARLLWHCGMSVTMDYGLDGSGSQTSYIASALQKYFGYPQSVKYFSRSGYSGDWQELILTEIREGRAVAYSGHDPKKNYGHCFNLDGWDGSFFHVNWGWGGTNNGYFGLDGLRDATMDMDYTDSQGVVIGIRAPSEYPMDITLSSVSVSEGAAIGTEVATVTVESEASNPSYSFTLVGPTNPITHKKTKVPFEVKDMKLVTTGEMLGGKKYTFDMTVKNQQNNHELTRTFTITVVDQEDKINSVTADPEEQKAYFSIAGQKLPSAKKGLNIVRQQQTDGKTKIRKVIIK